MKNLINANGTYININVFIKYFNIPARNLIDILTNSDEPYILHNQLHIQNEYYISVATLLFITYRYRTINESSNNITIKLLDTVDDVSKLVTKMVNIIIQASDLICNTDKLLVIDDKYIAAYLCIFSTDNEYILGISYSPLVRLKYTIANYGNSVKLVKLFYFNNLRDAKKCEGAIMLEFHRFRNSKGNFNDNLKLIQQIVDKYSRNLII